MDIKKNVGKRIREYRKSKSYTQDELAEIVGIDTVSLSKIETGRNYPSSENLMKLAEALDVEVYEFFIQDMVKTNDELLDDIYKEINKMKTDSKKLHTLLVSAKTLNSK